MEAKLEAYRLRKRRKETFENIKRKILNMIPFQGGNNEKQEKKETTVVEILSERSTSPTTDSTTSELQSDLFVSEENEEMDEVVEEQEDPLTPENKYMKYFFWIVYFLFWATCYAIAIELKFGTVYLIISGLFGIYFNTRTGPKRRGEISAYSVFNKNCESIDGTLNAEQFEREIRFGAVSVR